MPRRSLYNPEFDKLPAFGLRDDALDDQLRARSKEARSKRADAEARDDLDDDEHGSDDDAPFDDADIGPQPWRPDNRVTNTEVALFVANKLLESKETTSNVNCFLSGYELTRKTRRFDVEDFVTRKFGFLPKARRKDDWRGNYSKEGTRHKLVLKYSKLDPCVTVRLRGRARLVVYVAGGCIVSDGHAEPGILRDLAGRPVTWAHTHINDVFAVCVPRTEFFRKTIMRYQQAGGARRLRLSYLMVERMSGQVIGIDRFTDPVWDD